LSYYFLPQEKVEKNQEEHQHSRLQTDEAKGKRNILSRKTRSIFPDIFAVTEKIQYCEEENSITWRLLKSKHKTLWFFERI